MDLEIMSSVIAQAQKDKCCTISLVCKVIFKKEHERRERRLVGEEGDERGEQTGDDDRSS